MPTARATAILLLLLAAGCVTSREKIPGTPNLYRLPDGRVVRCELEAQTGSNIREMICHPAEEKLLADRDEYRKVLSKPAVQLQR